jgi:methylglyoxal synthase
MTSCTTTQSTITNPDGSSVTITQSGPAPGTIEAGAIIASQILAEK